MEIVKVYQEHLPPVKLVGKRYTQEERGNDKSGELYSAEASDFSMAALCAEGVKFSQNAWFFERYNDPRFVKPDEQGNVILDICAYLIEDEHQ